MKQTVKSRPASLADMVVRIIEFHDIVESCVVEYDQFADRPFDDTDCYNHTLAYAHDDDPNGFRLTYDNRRDGFCRGDRVVIVPDDFGHYDYYRSRGASKQVARELTADQLRSIAEDIKRIYSDDWASYGITCDYLDVSDSLWGIDGFDDAQHHAYLEECKVDVACEVADDLERSGRYRVVGRPDRRQEYVQNRIWHVRQNVNLFDRK